MAAVTSKVAIEHYNTSGDFSNQAYFQSKLQGLLNEAALVQQSEQQPVSPASGEPVNYVASEVVDMDSGMVYLDPTQRAGRMMFEVKAGRMTL